MHIGIIMLHVEREGHAELPMHRGRFSSVSDPNAHGMASGLPQGGMGGLKKNCPVLGSFLNFPVLSILGGPQASLSRFNHPAGRMG